MIGSGTFAGFLVALLLAPRLVPPLPPARRSGGPGKRRRFAQELVRPTLFAMVLFLATTVYFTYATDAVERGGLGGAAGPGVFVLVGASGLAGVAAGRLAGRAGRAEPAGHADRADHAGGRWSATTALVLLACALVLLGLAAGSLPAVLVSAALFGAANTVGSAALPVWTAGLVPDHATEAFTTTLVVGSVTAVLIPALVGTLVPVVGLRVVLLAAAILPVTAAVLIPLGGSVSTGRATPRRRGRAAGWGRSRRARWSGRG